MGDDRKMHMGGTMQQPPNCACQSLMARGGSV